MPFFLRVTVRVVVCFVTVGFRLNKRVSVLFCFREASMIWNRCSSLAASGNVGAEPVQPSAAKLSYEEQKELNKKRKKLERRVADCEAEIEQTEAAIAILEARMATPEGASDMSLYEQHQKLKEQLDRVMEEWDAATVELENH